MPPPSPPRRRPLLRTVKAAQYSVLTHSTNPPSKRSFSEPVRADRKRRPLLATTFFWRCQRSHRPWLPVPTDQRRVDRPSAEKRDGPFFPDQQSQRGFSASCAAILADDSANVYLFPPARDRCPSRGPPACLARELP